MRAPWWTALRLSRLHPEVAPKAHRHLGAGLLEALAALLEHRIFEVPELIATTGLVRLAAAPAGRRAPRRLVTKLAQRIGERDLVAHLLEALLPSVALLHERALDRIETGQLAPQQVTADMLRRLLPAHALAHAAVVGYLTGRRALATRLAELRRRRLLHLPIGRPFLRRSLGRLVGTAAASEQQSQQGAAPSHAHRLDEPVRKLTVSAWGPGRGPLFVGRRSRRPCGSRHRRRCRSRCRVRRRL